MNKKRLIGIILGLTILIVIVIIIFNKSIKYNNIIINNDEWENIINSRDNSTNIILENIEFNDYNLLIDNENSIIYYSVIDSSNKYNPSIKYITNLQVNMAINDIIKDEIIDQDSNLQIMFYNNNEYRIYSLVVTNYPLLNVVYQTNKDNKKNISSIIEIFDNHIDSLQRVLISDGKFKIIEKDNTYSFSLIKESLGNNKRDNYISIFGMEKRSEYIIKKVNNISENEKYVRLFINNKYMGLYSFSHKEGRVDIVERNKENNR